MNRKVLVNALKKAEWLRALPSPEGRRLLRERAGLTQEELARVVGVKRPTVCRWESGARNPRGRTLRSYVEVLQRLVLTDTKPFRRF